MRFGCQGQGRLPGGVSGASLAPGVGCTWDKGLIFSANGVLLENTIDEEVKDCVDVVSRF